MELFDKPPFKKASSWALQGGFAVLVLLVSLLFLQDGIKETEHYFATKNEAAILFAITINPSHPPKQLHDIASAATVQLFFSSLLLYGVFPFVLAPKRIWYVEAYGLRRVCIEKDVWRKHWQNMSLWLCSYVGVLTGVITFLMFREDAGFFPVLFLLFLGPGTEGFVSWLKDTKLIRQGNFRHSVFTLVNKGTKKDSDNDTVYILCYSNGNLTWEHEVSRVRCKEAQMGDTVVAVFLEGRKKPHLVYDDL